jgi:hypothetical protein
VADCKDCGASGKVWISAGTGPDYRKDCPACGGTGQVNGNGNGNGGKERR